MNEFEFFAALDEELIEAELDLKDARKLMTNLWSGNWDDVPYAEGYLQALKWVKDTLQNLESLDNA